MEWNNVNGVYCKPWLVLPTVFTDALSYGEQLNKFCEVLNKIIENNNNLPEFIQNLISEYINGGAIGNILSEILSDFILNVKYPPNGITPAKGDGTTDDTETIQACIDYAFNKGGGAVYFPSGNYSTKSITLKNGVSLIGFDRYSTNIVLRGGSDSPLLFFNGDGCGVYNLTLNGNAGTQTENVNVINMIAQNVLLSNLILENGYKLISYNGTGGTLNCNNIVFKNFVNEGVNISGNSITEISECVFTDGSQLTNSVITIESDNGKFEIISNVKCETCITINGNSNNIKAIINNATNNFSDNGSNNNIDINGEELSLKYNSVSIKGSDLTNEFETTYDNNTTKTFNTTDFIINSENPITYKKPEPINDYFSYIPMKSPDGTTYKVLVDEGGSDRQGVSAEAITTSNGAITKMLECCSSYYKNSALFTYGNFFGAFNTNCIKQGNFWEIDCSTFTQLCLMGVPYENSRYNGNSVNIPTSGYVFEDMIIDPDVDRPYGMLANGLAEYAYNHGFLYDINSNIYKIKPGDVLFVCNSPEETYWRKVGHCAIVIGTMPYNGTILCMSANTSGSTPINLELWSIANSQILFAARFPLTDCDLQIDDITNNGINLETSVQATIPSGSSTFLLKRVYFKETLIKGDFYTIVFKIKNGLPENTHLGIYGTLSTGYGSIRAFGGESGQTLNYSCFICPNEYSNTDELNGYKYIDIRLVLNNTQSDEFNQSITIESVSIIKGCVIPQYYKNLLPASANIENNGVATMYDTTITTDDDLNNFLNNIQKNTWNFTKSNVVINCTGYTGRLIKSGRYVVDSFYYSNGEYGFSFLRGLGNGAVYGRFSDNNNYIWYTYGEPTIFPNYSPENAEDLTQLLTTTMNKNNSFFLNCIPLSDVGPLSQHRWLVECVTQVTGYGEQKFTRLSGTTSLILTRHYNNGSFTDFQQITLSPYEG